MRFVTYLLVHPNGRLYTGSTGNLTRRIRAHRRAFGLDLEIAHKESFGTRAEAVQRERQIKGWTRAKKEALIDGELGKLVKLAHRRGGKPR